MKRESGGAAFEYLFAIVIIAVIAILATYWYRTHIVQKGFETSIQSLETGQDLFSQDLQRNTDTFASKVKFSGPMALAILCVVVLMMILFSTFRAAKRAKRGLKDISEDEDGQALTEFILTFPLLLFITLCIMQLSLLYTARLVVNYAAFSACRAAAVIIPQSIGGETEGLIKLKDEDSSDQNEEANKLTLIRNAARLACMPVSVDATLVTDNFRVTVFGHEYHPLSWVSGVLDPIRGVIVQVFNGLGQIFGSPEMGNYVNAAIGRYIYSYLFTDVELLDDSFQKITDDKTYGNEPVTVRVNHTFYMGIPLANAFLGERWGWNLFEDTGLSKLSDLFGGLNLSEYNTEVSGGYVFRLKAECTLQVEQKIGH